MMPAPENKIIMLLPADPVWRGFALVFQRIFQGQVPPTNTLEIYLLIQAGGAVTYCDASGKVVSAPELKAFAGILVLPLVDLCFAAFGLDVIGRLRQDGGCYFTALFMVFDRGLMAGGRLSAEAAWWFKQWWLGKSDIKDLKDLAGREKAVLFGELLFDADTLRPARTKLPDQPLNFWLLDSGGQVGTNWDILLSEFREKCTQIRRITELLPALASLRKGFYQAFYAPYDWQKPIPDCLQNVDLQCMKKIDHWWHRTVGASEVGYDHHHKKLNLFRSPQPFLFWDFVKSYLEVSDFYQLGTRDSPLPMFLLDNKDFIAGDQNDQDNKLKKINKIFENYGLCRNNNQGLVLFQCVYKSDAKKACCLKPYNHNNKPFKLFPESETVGLVGFDGEGNQFEINFSAYLVIFLDFFFSEDPPLRAHEFIADYNAYKLENNCFQNDWFFIVSAAHRDVLGYAEAGSLSSFSSLTRVDFGDNPLLPNREIIFVYKLLKFLQSRSQRLELPLAKIFAKFLGLSDSRRCADCAGSSFLCRLSSPIFDNLEMSKQCLRSGIKIVRQLLLACADESKVEVSLRLPSSKMQASTESNEISVNELQVLAQRLEHILLDFLGRPDADWAMIQLQITYLEESFATYGLRFKCGYIIEEMVLRSKIY